jgi:hypothetical protein
MSAASNFLENAVIESTLRGAAFPTISKVYVALHTSDPTDAGGEEVTSAIWPSYARQDAAKGGWISAGWTAAVDGVSKNALQLIFPVFDGAADLTVTHFSLHDASTGGNMLVHAPLLAQRTVQNGDVFVVDTQKLTVQCL